MTAFATTAGAQEATVVPAVVLSRIQIDYPSIAQAALVRGKVTVRVGVRPDGSVAETRLVEGVQLLSDVAVDAASHATFECRGCTEPATPHTITFVFSFDDLQDNWHSLPPSLKRTGDANSEVTVFGSFPICDHCGGSYPYKHIRAARCLWLWHCASS